MPLFEYLFFSFLFFFLFFFFFFTSRLCFCVLLLSQIVFREKEIFFNNQYVPPTPRECVHSAALFPTIFRT